MSITTEALSAGIARMMRIALKKLIHTKSGTRRMVMPGARIVRTVAMMLMPAEMVPMPVVMMATPQ